MIQFLEEIVEEPSIRDFIELIIKSAIKSANARIAVKAVLRVEQQELTIGNSIYPLWKGRRLRIVSIGKASYEMALGALDVLSQLILDGLVIAKNYQIVPEYEIKKEIRVMKGGHPLPTQESYECGQALWNFLQDGRKGDLNLTLISGGGSALVQLPKGDISIHDLQELTRKLINCGASIQEINSVRKQLDRLKGGGLWRAANPAELACLYVSDVKGNPIDKIASGMTIGEEYSSDTAIAILEKYDLMGHLPKSILDVLCRTLAEDTFQELAPMASHQILLDNSRAREAIVEVARMNGWNAQDLGWVLDGEASETGKVLARRLRYESQTVETKMPICLVGGGETTVRIRGDGVGGRNLETALAAVETLAGIKNVALFTLATDGEDAETGYAGALVSGKTAQLADQAGIDPENFLRNNDSGRFFKKVGGLIKTGPTGTNVNDLVIMLAW